MELGSYTERQRQRDPLNPQQQQHRYSTPFSHPTTEYNNNRFNFYHDRGTALRSAFAGGAAGGAVDAAEGWPLQPSDAAADSATADTNSTSSTRDALNTSYSPYDVAYRGQGYAENAFDQESPHPPEKKSRKLRALVIVLVLAAVSAYYLFERRRSLRKASRMAIDACDLDKEPACREYAFFDGFNEAMVRVVDEDPRTGNFLFRSSLPLGHTTGRLMLSELTAAMRAAAEKQALQLPEYFRMTLISLQWGESNGRLLEQCELAREACAARSAPQTATVHWPVYGQNVSPYSLPSHEREALAANFTAWDQDNLDQKVQVLYHVTHSFLEVPAAAQVNASPPPAAAGGGNDNGAATTAETAETAPAAGGAMRRRNSIITQEEGEWQQQEEEQERIKRQEEEGEENTGTAAAEDQSAGQAGHPYPLVHAFHQPLLNNASPQYNTALTTNPSSSPAFSSPSSSPPLQQISAGNIGSKSEVGGMAVSPSAVAAAAATPTAAVVPSLPPDAALRPAADALGSNAAVEAAAVTPLVSVVHCHHGKDRTGLLIGAYKLKYMQYSLQQVMEENLALGQDLVEAVNALMWYCLYLEKASDSASAAAGVAAAGAASAANHVNCFDAVAAYPQRVFISNGKAPHTPPGVLPPDSTVPRPLQPVDVARAPKASPTTGTPAGGREAAAAEASRRATAGVERGGEEVEEGGGGGGGAGAPKGEMAIVGAAAPAARARAAEVVGGEEGAPTGELAIVGAAAPAARPRAAAGGGRGEEMVGRGGSNLRVAGVSGQVAGEPAEGASAVAPTEATEPLVVPAAASDANPSSGRYAATASPAAGIPLHAAYADGFDGGMRTRDAYVASPPPPGLLTAGGYPAVAGAAEAYPSTAAGTYPAPVGTGAEPDPAAAAEGGARGQAVYGTQGTTDAAVYIPQAPTETADSS